MRVRVRACVRAHTPCGCALPSRCVARAAPASPTGPCRSCGARAYSSVLESTRAHGRPKALAVGVCGGTAQRADWQHSGSAAGMTFATAYRGPAPCHPGPAPCHAGPAPCQCGPAPCHAGPAPCQRHAMPAQRHAMPAQCHASAAQRHASAAQCHAVRPSAMPARPSACLSPHFVSLRKPRNAA